LIAAIQSAPRVLEQAATSMPTAPENFPDETQLSQEFVGSLRAIRIVLTGVFLIALVGLVYFARDFLLPVFLAFLLALTLSPIVRYLQKRGIAPGFAALVLVLLVVSGFFAGAYLLSDPIAEWVARVPEISQRVQQKLSTLRRPVEAVVKASEQVRTITEGTSEPTVQKVVVQQPGLLSKAAGNIISAVSTAAVTFVLLLFLLASGPMFYEKMINVLPTFRDKKRALAIAYDVEREVSQYLLTITLINISFGIYIAAVMTIVGMPNPVLWGVAALLLNYIPYVGALTGIAMVSVVALISFDSISYALIAPLLYFAAAILEGQFFTPMFLGRRLELNSVAILIFVAMWGWLWGIVGAIIAVPFLVLIKVFCDHFEGLAGIGEFLSGPNQTAATAAETGETTVGSP
jgi:predicted PurR-regulated permease PerM